MDPRYPAFGPSSTLAEERASGKPWYGRSVLCMANLLSCCVTRIGVCRSQCLGSSVAHWASEDAKVLDALGLGSFMLQGSSFSGA